MKQTLIIFFVLICFASQAQTVLLDVDRKKERVTTDRGPNLKKFSHFFIRGGMLVSADKAGARIIYGPSVNLGFGLRVKYKISPVYALGWEIENQYLDYKLKQQVERVIPDSLINDMSRYDYSTFVAGIYNRINFDPGRGNYLGKFLDIGIAGEWHYSIKYITKNDGQDGTLVKTVIRGLDYTNNFNARVYARLGLSHISIFGHYRLLDLWKTSSGYPDMPRVVAGIDLAIF
jgi:hypothetical protein